MKIFKTTTRYIFIIIILILSLNLFAYAYNYNPSKEEIESMIDDVAVERGIPSVILKSIARVESVYQQFNSDGSPKITGTSIGLMMINNIHGGYDSQRLKYDIRYNIEAGADVLLNKWSMSSYQSVPSVGNMDPNILENWYFALWAYNGWATSNNPNMLPSYVKKRTYQQLIYDTCKKEYDQTINNIDFSYLPRTGKPSRSLVVPTPENINSGGIILYEIGDYVRTDGVRSVYHLRDVPAGKYIRDVSVNKLGKIVDGPILEKGFYWYKIYINDYIQGWIERNWLIRTGDIEHGRYVFNDISYHWARKSIMELYNNGIVGDSENFNPDKTATKEEFYVLLSKTLDKANKENLNKETQQNAEVIEDPNDETFKNIQLPYKDSAEISLWATNYLKKLYKFGFLNDAEMLNPKQQLTRIDAALILSNVFVENKEYQSLDINQIFTDLTGLTDEEVAAVKKIYTDGLMTGKVSGSFYPNDYLSRAEAATIILKIFNKLK